jgi:hypothetical protein
MRVRNTGARPEDGGRLKPKAHSETLARRAQHRRPIGLSTSAPAYESRRVQLPSPPPPPVDPNELDSIFDIEDRVERAIAFARFYGREQGWSEVQIFNDALGHLDRLWYRWDRANDDHGIAWVGFRRDFHLLRQRFLHLPEFRQPNENVIVYPRGSYEPTLRAWYERELKWTREWKSAELELGIYGGDHVVLH